MEKLCKTCLYETYGELEKPCCECIGVGSRWTPKEPPQKAQEYNGWRLLREITVKALILAGARDVDVEYFIYPPSASLGCIVPGSIVSMPYELKLTTQIQFDRVIDYASHCPEKLQWLVDKGFIEKVEESLKPCPFCGGVAKIRAARSIWVRCPNCGAGQNVSQTKQKTVEKWNQRV
ncbi:hypothetical protein ES708_00724 [subsurface metagenome]